MQVIRIGEYDPQKVSAEVATTYAVSLKQHIDNVRKAAYSIGVDQKQAERHDESKYSFEEFGGYAMHFHGGGAPDAFAVAWLHHIHVNPHHWQHWLFPDGFTPKGSNVEGGAIEMPEPFALEMIADWMGASSTYTGSWDMTDWLQKNAPRIRLHSKTARYVRAVLNRENYYNLTPNLHFLGET